MKYYRYSNRQKPTHNTKYLYRNNGVSGYEWYDKKDNTWNPTRMSGYSLNPDFFKEISEEEVFMELV